MAAEAGVSAATVQRVWAARGLKPHLAETFKLSNDPMFEEKLVDVVGLYLNPPDQAVVLCMDEKSSIRALDRTQPSLLLKPGRAGTMTSDHKRHGTTTLFAALDVLTGNVIGKCFARHRHDEFLRTIDTSVPRKLQVPAHEPTLLQERPRMAPSESNRAKVSSGQQRHRADNWKAPCTQSCAEAARRLLKRPKKQGQVGRKGRYPHVA